MAKILGHGAPTSGTYAILGQEYIDKLTGKRYICTKSQHITSDKAGEADHYCEWVEEGANASSDVSTLKELVLYSSTEGSTKKFKVTVDDEGKITAIRAYNYTEALVASSFDNTGDGIAEVYSFSPTLSVGFSSENAIQIDAVKDVTDNNGVHQEAGSHYLKYDEVAAGIGTLPPHVYCYDNSSANYLRYSFEVEEDGIYELAAHLRIKDEQLRGATYIINKDTQYEHSFVTTYGWDSESEALAIRNDDESQGAYMRGMLVYLHAGINTIHITPAAGVTKNQHFRNLYLVKIDDLCDHNIPEHQESFNYLTCIHCREHFELDVDYAEAMGVGLAKGAKLPDYYYIEVTFNNGEPRSTDGFCRVNTENGHKMSIQRITLADGQTMPLAGDTVLLRGKLGCVNSTVNGGIGREARIFDATIVRNYYS